MRLTSKMLEYSMIFWTPLITACPKQSFQVPDTVPTRKEKLRYCKTKKKEK